MSFDEVFGDMPLLGRSHPVAVAWFQPDNAALYAKALQETPAPLTPAVPLSSTPPRPHSPSPDLFRVPVVLHFHART